MMWKYEMPKIYIYTYKNTYEHVWKQLLRRICKASLPLQCQISTFNALHVTVGNFSCLWSFAGSSWNLEIRLYSEFCYPRNDKWSFLACSGFVTWSREVNLLFLPLLVDWVIKIECLFPKPFSTLRILVVFCVFFSGWVFHKLNTW